MYNPVFPFLLGRSPAYVGPADIWFANLTGLPRASSFWFRARALTSAGPGPANASHFDSAYTPRASFHTDAADCTTPLAPTWLAVDAGSYDVECVWARPSNDGGAEVTSYQLEWGADGGGEAQNGSSRVATTWPFVNQTFVAGPLTPATTYSLWLRARNNRGVGEMAAEMRVTTSPALPPAAPARLFVSGDDGVSVMLNWSAAETPVSK